MSDDQHLPLGQAGFNRRTFLTGATAGAVGGGILGLAAARFWMPDAELASLSKEAKVASPSASLGIPGRYPGRVIEVHHPDAARGYARNAAAVTALVERGMKE